MDLSVDLAASKQRQVSDDFRISQNYDTTSKAFSNYDTTFVSLSSVGKALDGRPRPQKQLSQPTLGATEHMEAGRLRGSQSSEGSELIHSMSVNTSSPNSGTYNSDTSRDTDMGKLSYRTASSNPSAEDGGRDGF